jgi:hypothetical protein
MLSSISLHDIERFRPLIIVRLHGEYMKRKYLGDSYDALKRMWQELLSDWAPLYAAPAYIPADLRKEFTQLTRIPILKTRHPSKYSILNDPDTGIRLPDETNQKEGRTHISIDTIINQLKNSGAQCVITYDQSNYRNIGMKLNEQRKEKMGRILSEGFHSFYYVSHAPFLFAVPNIDALSRIQVILKNAGMPDNRFEKYQ